MELKLESLEDLMRIPHLYKLSVVMHFALSSDLFELLGGDSLSADELAQRCSCQPEGLEIVLNILVNVNLLRLNERKYENTQLSLKYLTQAYRTKMDQLMLYFMKSDLSNASLSSLIGTTPALASRPEEEGNVLYMEAMDTGNKLAAVKLSRTLVRKCKKEEPISLLDAGCGSGIFSITACKLIPNLRVVAVDHEDMLVFTEQKVAESGMAGRISLIARDLSHLDFAGEEKYDYILLSNVLHFFQRAAIQQMISYCYSSLKPGGSLIVNDIFGERDNIDSLFYSLEWLSNKVCFPDLNTLSTMLREAGYSHVAAESVASGQSSMIFAEKRVKDAISLHP